MKYTTENDFIILKIETGDDVFKTMKDLVSSEKITSGIVLSGIGMINNGRVGYLNVDKYVEMTFEEPREVVSFSGSISENEPIFHIHGLLQIFAIILREDISFRVLRPQ
ncbi:DNA-binding protein [mine drainage metagenome]|uniref:DNA-binding protein n=1 Tax=mine drainage metagenome TaxID=410659 RepID=T1D1Y4_9ZZZZ